MALDNAQFMSELSITDPPGTDPLSEGDDQIRTSKRTQLQSFPNVDKAVTTTADELNDVAIKSVFNNFTATNTFNAITTFGAQIHSSSGTELLPGYAFTTVNDMGMRAFSVTQISWSTQGVERLRLGSAGLDPFVNIRAPDGVEAIPAYQFFQQSDSGMFRLNSAQIGFSVGGNIQLIVGSAGLVSTPVIKATSGTAASPSYQFTSSLDAGMYRVSSAGIGFAHGGVRRFFYTSTLVEFEIPTQHINENTVTRTADTQPRTGWRFTSNANLPQWAIYLGTSPDNTLAFQRYVGGAFQDIPLSIRQANGLIRMSTLPSSSAGLIAGELWRNPVSPGFVAIV